jgi:hypothetical protein
MWWLKEKDKSSHVKWMDVCTSHRRNLIQSIISITIPLTNNNNNNNNDFTRAKKLDFEVQLYRRPFVVHS